MNVRRKLLASGLLVLGFGAAMIVPALGGEEKTATPAPQRKPPIDRATLEKQFATALSGATLSGHFTRSDKPEEKLAEERYTIAKVSKLKDDYWMFQTRIQYGGHDVTLPLALEVKWAGDTPVITLIDVLVPGFGTFTARVLVYRDQYAGTWSGGDHGGQLFGTVSRDAAKPAGDKATDATPPAKSK